MDSTTDRHHLFGDIYWQPNAVTTALFVLFLATLVPFNTWTGIFTEQARWVLVNYPDVMVWVARNYGSLSLLLLGAAVGFGIRLGAGDGDD